jgi:NADH-quinone oxidoreductase subunit J
MEITLDLIVFTVLAVFMTASAVLAVTTKRILRAATCLLFVLFGTAGIYFQLNYSFLGAVQLLIYAGGITVLYVFSILLTSGRQGDDHAEKLKKSKMIAGLVITAAALTICLFLTLKNRFLPSHFDFDHGELDVNIIGHALMGIGKYQYLLPFEVISILLLACIVGVILIARKR